MSLIEGKALVAQGGGPTAVINQSVAGVVTEARRYPQITRVYGALHGIQGIVEEDLIDLTQVTTDNLEAVAATPSSGLLSTRIKPTLEICHKILEVCRAHGIRYFFYITNDRDTSADEVAVRVGAESTGAFWLCGEDLYGVRDVQLIGRYIFGQGTG